MAMSSVRIGERLDRCPAAFTLIELLAVVAVIAVLISILVPAIRISRNRARDVVCLANHRQFATAWAAYATDEGQFPFADEVRAPGQMFVWGGVDWYADDFDPSFNLHVNRPLNPYLGASKRQRDGLEVFRCPRDDSMRYTVTDDRINWEENFGYASQAEDANGSIYAILGTSYVANDWIWVHPQSEDGYGDYPWPHARPNMGPDDVVTSPSQFLLMIDCGANYPGRYRQGVIYQASIAYAWWHGEYIGMCTFLDGSARREELDGVHGNTYSYYSNPEVQQRGGVRP